VYNLALEQCRDWWRPGRKIRYLSQQSELTALRAEVDWLKAVPVHALQMAVRAVDTAYQKFFAGLCEYPKPHRKFQRDSFTLPDPSYLGFRRYHKRHGAIRVPKLGWVKLRGWRPLGGELRSITIRRKAGHWYASVAWQSEVADPKPSAMPAIGIDRGIVVFAALSEGRQVAPLNAFKRIVDKLAKAQRRLARKIEFSANWQKQKTKISRLHLHAANARKDYLHNRSTEIAKSHGVVKIESLRIKNMSASASGTVDNPGTNVRAKSGLNRSILDQGWGMFATMLDYKLAKVEAAYTSQTCAECGVVDTESRIDQATFQCRHCGHTDNADINAARNILQARIIAVEPPKRTLTRVGKRKRREEVAHAA
jgi:putative transposase